MGAAPEFLPCLAWGPKRYLGLGKYGARYRCNRPIHAEGLHQRWNQHMLLLCEWNIIDGQPAMVIGRSSGRIPSR